MNELDKAPFNKMIKISDEVQVQIKRSLHKRWLILTRDLYKRSEPNKKAPCIGEARRSQLCGAIVFLAFALESFINEFSLEHCKQEFQSIEKLPTKEKWFIIPRLFSAKGWSRAKEPFQSISLIFRYRDKIAHYKPQFKDATPNAIPKRKEFWDKLNHTLFKHLYKNAVGAMKQIYPKCGIKCPDWVKDLSSEA